MGNLSPLIFDCTTANLLTQAFLAWLKAQSLQVQEVLVNLRHLAFFLACMISSKGCPSSIFSLLMPLFVNDYTFATLGIFLFL